MPIVEKTKIKKVREWRINVFRGEKNEWQSGKLKRYFYKTFVKLYF
jgi:hypothetical protein